MTDTSSKLPLPDRLAIDPCSPHHVAALFQLLTLKGVVEAFYK